MGVRDYPQDAAALDQSMQAIDTYAKLAENAEKKGASTPILKLEGEGKSKHLTCINVGELGAFGRVRLWAQMKVSPADYNLQTIRAFLDKIFIQKGSSMSNALSNMKARLDLELAGKTKSSPGTTAVYQKTMTPAQAKIATFIQNLPEKYTKGVDLSKLKKELGELEKSCKGVEEFHIASAMLGDLELQAGRLELEAKSKKPLPIPPDVERPIFKKPGEASPDVSAFVQKLLQEGPKNVADLRKELNKLVGEYKEDPGLPLAKELLKTLETEEELKTKPPPAPPPKPEVDVSLKAHPIIGQGIGNAGNSCYLNATMQALRACEPFRQHLTTTKPIPPQDALGLALSEINTKPSGTIRQFWEQIFLLNLQEEPEAKAAFIDRNASNFGIPRAQVLALKDDLIRFSNMDDVQRKNYIKPVLHDAIFRVFKDLESGRGAASADSSHYLRLMAIAGGFALSSTIQFQDRATTRQEDASEFCVQLFNLLDFPDVVSSTDIDYHSDRLGFHVLTLERQRNLTPTKIVSVAIADATPGSSLQALMAPNTVKETIQLLDTFLSEWPFTPEELERLTKTLDVAIADAIPGSSIQKLMESASKSEGFIFVRPFTTKEKQHLIKALKKVINPVVNTTQTVQLKDPPPALLPISLNRFAFDNRTLETSKIGKVLHAPDNLEIAIAGDPTRKAQYKLVSGVIHDGGKSTDSGHYTAYSKINNQMNYYNDSSVTPSSAGTAESVLSTKGYLFFYTFAGYVLVPPA